MGGRGYSKKRAASGRGWGARSETTTPTVASSRDAQFLLKNFFVSGYL